MTVIPINYKLSLKPDLEKFSFNGFLKLILESEKETKSICLNILELDIHECRIEIGDKPQDCDFDVNTDSESLTIKLPEPVSGKFGLLIKYTGIINDQMAGFYRSQYVSGGNVYPIAVTQFQESDARRAFPCFDHPGQKAVFDIELTINRHLTAISNQDIETEALTGNDKKTVVFKQSPRMSTYLVCWCIGAFQFIEDRQDRRVRIAVLPGMEPYAEFGLDFGRKALAYCEDYYGIAYPLTKLDLIAIPDFAFGAMENWGAITFRENLLLFYPEITSNAGAERIAEVISHEIAHQWFGNLVTPADWKFLWLNESFATYFGFGVVDHYHPDWEIWPQFLHSQTHPALVRDAYLETIPIEIPGGEHVVINTSTAPIIYCKGGSILRQIKGYVGEEIFTKGVRHYLNTYAYDCAASHHLWEAFESVSSKPVTKIMQSWLEQAGYPIIEVERSGNALTFHQTRFSYQPNHSSQIWQIPISISICSERGEWRSIDFLMDRRSQTVDVGDDVAVYKINQQQTGFYRVKYADSRNLEKLGMAIRHQTLTPEDRWGIENDLFARVKCQDVSLDAYLGFTGYFENETNFLPLMSVADNLFHAFLLSGKVNQGKIAQAVIRQSENVLSGIGYDPHADEAHTTGILRDQFIWLGVFFGSEKVTAFAEDQFGRLTDGDQLHPDIMKSILQTGAFAGNSTTFDWFIQRFENAVSEHDRANMLFALGCFQDPEVLQKVRAYTLTNVPARNQSIPISSMAMNPAAMHGLWAWYKNEKDAFIKFHPLIHERVFASIVPAGNTVKADDVRSFLSANQVKINPDVVELTLERLEVNQRLRKKFNE